MESPNPRAHDRPTYIVAVGSGKGGVGKSTVTANLAVALVSLGWRVGVLDADIYGPDIGVMFGVRRRTRVSHDVMLPIGHRQSLMKSAQIPAVERFRVQTFSVGMMLGEQQAITLDGRFAGMLVRQLIHDVAWGPLDVLLLDLPPGTAEPHRTVAKHVNLSGVVLVTTPQAVAQIDTNRMLQFYVDAGVPVLGTVLNMSYFQCPDCGSRHVIWPHHNAPEGSLRYPLLAELPLAPEVAEAGDRGKPTVVAEPEGVAAKAFIEAAQCLRSRLEALNRVVNDSGIQGIGKK